MNVLTFFWLFAVPTVQVFAVQKNQLEVVEAMLATDPTLANVVQPRNGVTPLFSAKFNGLAAMADLLLAAGADPSSAGLEKLPRPTKPTAQTKVSSATIRAASNAAARKSPRALHRATSLDLDDIFDDMMLPSPRGLKSPARLHSTGPTVPETPRSAALDSLLDELLEEEGAMSSSSGSRPNLHRQHSEKGRKMLFDAYHHEDVEPSFCLQVSTGGSVVEVTVPETANVASLKEALFAHKHTELLPAAQKIVVKGAVASNEQMIMSLVTAGPAPTDGTPRATTTKLMLLRDHSYVPTEVKVHIWLPEKPWVRVSIR
jgi:hypothetical protein